MTLRKSNCPAQQQRYRQIYQELRLIARHKIVIRNGIFTCFYNQDKLYIWNNKQEKPVAYFIKGLIKVRRDSKIADLLASAFNAKVIRSKKRDLFTPKTSRLPEGYTKIGYGSRWGKNKPTKSPTIILASVQPTASSAINACPITGTYNDWGIINDSHITQP